MPVGRTAVSMHLRVLKDAGLVRDQAAGNRRVYRLDPDAMRQLRDHLDWYWEHSLGAFKDAAEAAAGNRQEGDMTARQRIVVTKTVRVSAPLAVAFDVFAGQAWWPVDTHHLAEPHGSEVILEQYQAGRWYERGPDGTETDWGTVLAWQPPYRIVLTWQVGPRWTYQPDPARSPEIEATFTREGDGLTRVEVNHRHIERYGPEAERMRRILDTRGGEPLDAFARHVSRHTPPSAKGARP